MPSRAGSPDDLVLRVGGLSHGRDSSSVCDIRREEPTAFGEAAGLLSLT
jgi:hypothetical protein